MSAKDVTVFDVIIKIESDASYGLSCVKPYCQKWKEIMNEEIDSSERREKLTVSSLDQFLWDNKVNDGEWIDIKNNIKRRQQLNKLSAKDDE